MPHSWIRPTPILERTGRPVDSRTDWADSAQQLLAGETLCVADRYRTGVGIIDALVQALRPPLPTADYAAKQRFREAFREHAFRLLAPVVQGQTALDEAPHNGFLRELYADLDTFWLPFPEVRDLGFAWHRYEQGVPMAVLGHRLHPFYGTYLPKRTVHLELFATWLSQWSGSRHAAIDVGTGSGVLALMLARAGFEQVFATDVNPNAVESVRRECARLPEPPAAIQAHQADLLGDHAGPFDLVVFNPPWSLGPVDTLLDRALNYDDETLFPRFFDAAHERLAPGGRVVLVFSNVLGLVQPDVANPIEVELERGRFQCVNKMVRRVRPPRGGPKPARRTKERMEIWELATS